VVLTEKPNFAIIVLLGDLDIASAFSDVKTTAVLRAPNQNCDNS
jgi:hypothetical protein